MKLYLCLFAVLSALLAFSCGEVKGSYFGDSDNNSISTYCNEVIYDASKSFCFEDKVYPLCDKKSYDPSVDGCLEGKIFPKCDETPYDNTKNFCSGGSIYSKCNGNDYTPDIEFCFNKRIYLKCENKPYNPSIEFCFENKAYPLCNGESYKVSDQLCFKGNIKRRCPNSSFEDEFCEVNGKDTVSYRICGSGSYESVSKFCFKDEIYKKCGTKEYDPSKEFCYNDQDYYPRCGGDTYSPVNDFCFGGVVNSKCGGQEYNPNESLCYGTKLYFKCADGGISELADCSVKYKEPPPTCGILAFGEECCFGVPYQTSTHFCHESELYPTCGLPSPYYDPDKKGCFEGKLYDKCSLDNIVGPCVDNTLKRCRQLGSGPDYTIDPLPEMECKSNGAITGITKSGGYSIAQIGSQVWMAENLREDYKMEDSETGTVSSSVCYDNNPANCTTYGRLYDWALGMGVDGKYNRENNGDLSSGNLIWSGPCPRGFYIPRDEDWKELMKYAGGAAVAGGRLKSTSGWSDNGNGLDAYGFNAKPGGYYSDLTQGTGYFDIGKRSMWWSASQHPEPDAYYWSIISADTEVRNFYQSKGLHKAYVRCVLYYKEPKTD